VATTSQNPKPLLGVLQGEENSPVCSKAWHSKPQEDLTFVLVEIYNRNLIMQLTVHVQLQTEVTYIVKEHITNIYKHTKTICELWMLSTFISHSYTNK
jgi:hypothetical protein